MFLYRQIYYNKYIIIAHSIYKTILFKYIELYFKYIYVVYIYVNQGQNGDKNSFYLFVLNHLFHKNSSP